MDAATQAKLQAAATKVAEAKKELADAYRDGLRRLAAYGDIALDALGGVPPRPLVAFDDEVDDEVVVDEGLAASLPEDGEE